MLIIDIMVSSESTLIDFPHDCQPYPVSFLKTTVSPTSITSSYGTVTLSHRKGWVFDTDDELFDIMAERFVRMIRDYKDYAKIETERLLEAL